MTTTLAPIEAISYRPPQVPFEKLQAIRLSNLGRNVLDLSLEPNKKAALAQLAADGCWDALDVGNSEQALAFSRMYSIYSDCGKHHGRHRLED